MSGSVRMELDDLLEQEGLDVDGVEQTLEWARARAEELVRGMADDPELGPLLSGAAATPSDATAPRPRAVTPRPRAITPRPRAITPRPRAITPRPRVATPAPLEPLEAEAPAAELDAPLEPSMDPAVEPAPAAELADRDELPIDVEDDAPEAVTDPASLVPLPIEGGVAQAVSSDELDATAPVLTNPDASVPVPQMVTDPPSYGLTAAEAELAMAEAELAAAEAELARVAAEEAEAAVAAAAAKATEPELDPLAGFDFDSLPGDDEDGEDDGLAPSVEEVPMGAQPRVQTGDTLVPTEGPEGHDATIPSMAVPLAHDVTLTTMSAPASEAAEITLRAPNPLQQGAPEEVPANVTERTEPAEDEDDATADEPEEIMMLDDDMIELVEVEEDEEEEVPEWQAALNSAQMGGGRQADEDSGLLRAPTSAPAPAPAAPPPAPADEDEDVDLGDF